MDAQSNSDLNLTPETETLTSSDGPQPSKETPKFNWETDDLFAIIANKKKCVEDDTARMWVSVHKGRVFIETRLYGPFVVSTYKHWKTIQSQLEDILREKGFTEYFALIDTEPKLRWMHFLGFGFAGESLTLSDGSSIDVMVRNL